MYRRKNSVLVAYFSNVSLVYVHMCVLLFCNDYILENHTYVYLS